MGMMKFKHSPLPAPPAKYSHNYMLQLIRGLEQYFSRLDSKTPIVAEEVHAGVFLGTLAGATTEHAQLSTSAAQTVSASNVWTYISFGGTKILSDGFTSPTGAEIDVDTTGVFSAQLQLQITRATSSGTGTSDDIEIMVWLNGSTYETTTHHVVNGKQTVSMQTLCALTEGDQLRFMWRAPQAVTVTLTTGQAMLTWVSAK